MNLLKSHLECLLECCYLVQNFLKLSLTFLSLPYFLNELQIRVLYASELTFLMEQISFKIIFQALYIMKLYMLYERGRGVPNKEGRTRGNKATSRVVFFYDYGFAGDNQ